MEIKYNIMNYKILKVNINEIKVYKDMPRKNVTDAEIIALATSIKKNGLLCPLSVRKDIRDNKKYILVSGFRRYLALKFLNATIVPVIIYSLTEAEAELFFLCEEINRKNITIFEKAEAIKKMITSERIKKEEICESISVSTQKLKKILSVLQLSDNQKKIIINHSFSEEFIFTFLKVEKEKREEILNYIIANRLSNDMAINYINDYLNPKKEPKKTVCITSDKIILNSLDKIANNLKTNGIEASIRENNFEDRTEFTLVIEKKLKQLSLL